MNRVQARLKARKEGWETSMISDMVSQDGLPTVDNVPNDLVSTFGSAGWRVLSEAEVEQLLNPAPIGPPIEPQIAPAKAPAPIEAKKK